MINKFVDSVADAVGYVADGSTVVVGGFGSIGQPLSLIDGLIEQGARDLVVVANNAGVARAGLARLLDLRRVRKMVCSFPRSSIVFDELYKNREIELEVVPQGTLAERLRAAGAGIPAFYTPTAYGTKLARGKETREFDGRHYVLEHALKADLALLEAWEADRWGNLTYNAAGRNFNPVMATAATVSVAQVAEIVPLGNLDPAHIVTPGIYIDRILHIPIRAHEGAAI